MITFHNLIPNSLNIKTKEVKIKSKIISTTGMETKIQNCILMILSLKNMDLQIKTAIQNTKIQALK